MHDREPGADVGLLFRLLPRIPVMLLFWDEDRSDGFDAEVKLLIVKGLPKATPKPQ